MNRLRPSQKAPSFDVSFGTSGVDNLPRNITLNGTEVEPFFVLDARDATATTWPARVGSATFTLTGSGDDPVQLETALIDGTQEVRRQASGKSWRNSTDFAPFGFGTDDIFILAVMRHDGYARIVSTTDTTSTMTFISTTGAFSASSKDSATASITWNSAGVDTEATHIVALAYDRDHTTGIQGYVNGTVSGSPANASTHSAEVLTPNAGYTGIFDSSGVAPGLLYYAAYKASDLYDGNGAAGAEVTALAAELSDRFWGVYANRADDRSPTFTRASVATIQNTTTGAVTPVPAGVPVVEADGYRPEAASTNLATNSDKTTGWTDANATLVTSATRSPLGWFFEESTEDATASVAHGQTQSLTVVNATEYIYGEYLKASGRTIVYLEADGNRVWFNLSTGAVLTETGAEGTAAETTSGSGVWRCQILTPHPALPL